MIKIFTTNQNGKIELTKQELLELIEEIKQECRKEKTEPIAPVSPALPTHPVWTTPYCATGDDVRIREGNTTGVFRDLLKELNF